MFVLAVALQSAPLSRRLARSSGPEICDEAVCRGAKNARRIKEGTKNYLSVIISKGNKYPMNTGIDEKRIYKYAAPDFFKGIDNWGVY